MGDNPTQCDKWGDIVVVESYKGEFMYFGMNIGMFACPKVIINSLSAQIKDSVWCSSFSVHIIQL
jgi:hypothetical protein